MRLQPPSEHPHGIPDSDFDALFTVDKPIIFAFHGYPWLIHRLTYRRPATTTFTFAATRRRGPRPRPSTCACSTTSTGSIWSTTSSTASPRLAPRAAYAKQEIRDKLIDHKEYICRYGDDMPEIKDWVWGGAG